MNSLQYNIIFSAVVVVFLAIVTGVVMSSLHKIEEGNVGIYYKYGALMETTTGLYFIAYIIVQLWSVPLFNHL